MKKVLSWFIAIPVAALALAFAVDNRADVSLGLWPLPYRIDVPLFGAVLGGALLGFLGGALIAWVQGGKSRRLARQRRRRIETLERELATVEVKRAGRDEAPSVDIPRIAAGGGR